MLFDTLSGAFSRMNGMNWSPQQGWAYSGAADRRHRRGRSQGRFHRDGEGRLRRAVRRLVGNR